MTFNKMKELANEGDPLMEILTTLNRSSNEFTCTRENSFNEIDFILSTIDL
jgi:hypothetical protein